MNLRHELIANSFDALINAGIESPEDMAANLVARQFTHPQRYPLQNFGAAAFVREELDRRGISDSDLAARGFEISAELYREDKAAPGAAFAAAARDDLLGNAAILDAMTRIQEKRQDLNVSRMIEAGIATIGALGFGVAQSLGMPFLGLTVVIPMGLICLVMDRSTAALKNDACAALENYAAPMIAWQWGETAREGGGCTVEKETADIPGPRGTSLQSTRYLIRAKAPALAGTGLAVYAVRANGGNGTRRPRRLPEKRRARNWRVQPAPMPL